MCSVFVMKHLNSKMLLGADFLNKNEILLDSKNGILIPATQVIRKAQVCNTILNESITVPAMTERKVRVSTEKNLSKSSALFLPRINEMEAAVIEVDATGGSSVILMNDSVCDKFFPRGHKVGHAEAVSVEQIFADVTWKEVSEACQVSAATKVEVPVPLLHLPTNLQQKYREVIKANAQAFSLRPEEIGHCKVLPQSIILKDPNSITNIPPYRIAPNLQPVVENYVQNLLKTGIIRRSTSPFCSPLLLVRKANPNGPNFKTNITFSYFILKFT